MSQPNLDGLRAQLEVWRHSRALYPGWAVAPNEVRARVWRRTEDWLQPFARAGELSPRERVGALFELNWRLELCLSPVWNDLVPVYEAALRTVLAFPELAGELAAPELALGPDTVGACDWAAVRREWLALAFALLRYYREERRRGEFDTWAGRLGRVADLGPDDRARLCHERCLRALGDMNDDSARAALDDWPHDAPDLMWAVRRAAILGELGETAAARLAVEAAIGALRAVTPRAAAAAIPSLSREAWAIQLLSWADMEASLDGPRPRRSAPDDSMTSPERLGCDAEVERAFFRHRLDRPPPPPEAPVTVSPRFEPGRYSRTFHSGGDLFRTMFLAYQYVQFTEDAADPPRFGKLGLAAAQLAQAARWFLAHDPVRTWTLLCRLRDRKLIDECLPRHRVAALSLEVVADLYEAGVHAAEGALPRSAGYTFREPDPRIARAHKTLEAAVTLLARVAIRRPPADLDRIWDLALVLFTHPTVRESLVLHHAVEQLLHSLIVASPDDLLAGRFEAVLTLPVPGSADQPVHHPDMWREYEVVRQFVGRARANLPRKADVPRLGAFVNKLLDLAAGEPSPVRDKALGRLLLLHECGYLTRAEADQLAQTWWTPVPDEPGVPEVGGFYRWVCLVLPEPDGVRSVERFRRTVLSATLPPVRPGISGASAIMRDWLDSTDVPGWGRPERGQRHIDWTPGEAERMAALIADWWAADGRPAARQFRSIWDSLFGDELDTWLGLCLDVLRFVVVPRLDPGSAEVGRVVAFADDVGELGLPVGALLPSLLLLDPKFDVAARLRRALVSQDRAVRVSGLRGLLHWLGQPGPIAAAERSVTAPPAPPDLVLELGDLCAARRQPGLVETLDTVAAVLGGSGPAPDERFVQSVLIGLEYLLTEAAYRPTDDAAAHIPDADLPQCRARIARVVGRLARLGRTDPTVVRWQAELSADPLPEVRRALGTNGTDD